MLEEEHFEKFVLPLGFAKAVDLEECLATLYAMHECQIDRAPYSTLAIEVAAKEIFTVKNSPHGFDNETLLFEYRDIPQFLMKGERELNSVTVKVTGKKKGFKDLPYLQVLPEVGAQDTAQALGEYGQQLLSVLVVLLASKQVVKVRKDLTKLKALGIGKKNPYSYVTTLRLPTTEECETEGEESGRPCRPHLRRGHVRRQHWGLQNSYVKKIFIEPVWVNTDQEFISLRDRYNVSLKGTVH